MMAIQKKIFTIIRYLFLLFIGIILLIVLISDKISFSSMNQFNYIQLIYFLMGLIILGACIYICFFLKGKSVKKYDFSKVAILVTLLLFAIKTVIAYYTHVLASWDISAAVIPAAKSMVTQDLTLQEWFSVYYSRYPNNIILCWVYSKFFKFLNYINRFNSIDSLFLLVIANNIISSIQCYLVYYCTEKLFGKKCSMIAWGTNILLSGCSPWYLITYSDPLSVFISITILSIYINDFKSRILCFFKWLAIGFLLFWGYYIKPQSIIIVIAILIVEFIRCIEKKQKIWNIINIFALMISVLFSFGIYNKICKQFPFPIDQEQALSLPHFAMMGLNDETDGKYFEDDVNFSASFTTSKERTNANIKKIEERLKNYEMAGYLKLLVNKTAICYTDGTFGYSDGAMHPEEIFNYGNKTISNSISNYIYPFNNGFDILNNTFQVVWFFVLSGLFLMGVFCKYCNDDRVIVIMLTIIGSYLFEMLFEVQPRHLYTNLSIYIIAGSLGIYKFGDWIYHNVRNSRTDKDAGIPESDMQIP